jgi:hypothetical protein
MRDTGIDSDFCCCLSSSLLARVNKRKTHRGEDGMSRQGDQPSSFSKGPQTAVCCFAITSYNESARDKAYLSRLRHLNPFFKKKTRYVLLSKSVS